MILEIEGSIFHDELDDSLGGDGLALEVDGIVLHLIPEEDQSGSMLYGKLQLLLDLIKFHIASQQQ